VLGDTVLPIRADPALFLRRCLGCRELVQGWTHASSLSPYVLETIVASTDACLIERCLAWILSQTYVLLLHAPPAIHYKS